MFLCTRVRVCAFVCLRHLKFRRQKNMVDVETRCKVKHSRNFFMHRNVKPSSSPEIKFVTTPGGFALAFCAMFGRQRRNTFYCYFEQPHLCPPPPPVLGNRLGTWLDKGNIGWRKLRELVLPITKYFVFKRVSKPGWRTAKKTRTRIGITTWYVHSYEASLLSFQVLLIQI